MSSADSPPQTGGQRNEGCSMGILKWDDSYVRNQWEGRLKVVEVICTLLAGAVLPGSAYRHTGSFSFFSFVAWTSFINAVIDLILHLSSLWGRLLYICRAPEIYMVLCAIASGSFLLASALTAGFAHWSTNTTAASVAAFFGFVCMVLFGIEAFLHFLTFRNGRREMVRKDEPDEFAEPI